jgi:hypothetical protein
VRYITSDWAAVGDNACMPSYNDLMELARICLRQARQTASPAVADELQQMARDYQRRAAALNGGTPPDIVEDELPSP